MQVVWGSLPQCSDSVAETLHLVPLGAGWLKGTRGLPPHSPCLICAWPLVVCCMVCCANALQHSSDAKDSEGQRAADLTWSPSAALALRSCPVQPSELKELWPSMSQGQREEAVARQRSRGVLVFLHYAVLPSLCASMPVLVCAPSCYASYSRLAFCVCLFLVS